MAFPCYTEPKSQTFVGAPKAASTTFKTTLRNLEDSLSAIASSPIAAWQAARALVLSTYLGIPDDVVSGDINPVIEVRPIGVSRLSVGMSTEKDAVYGLHLANIESRDYLLASGTTYNEAKTSPATFAHGEREYRYRSTSHQAIRPIVASHKASFKSRHKDLYLCSHSTVKLNAHHSQTIQSSRLFLVQGCLQT